MATIFKNLSSTDIASTRTLLHEAIPITGSIVSGTYQVGGDATEENIKNYSHGMFQSIYDYPFLSSSANQIFDITMGYSSVISSSAFTQNTKKVNIYNQMAQVLNGYDQTGSIKKFQTSGGVDQDAMVFFNFARLLTKDEVKKESLTMTFASGGVWNQSEKFTNLITLTDLSGNSNYRVDSPAGEYGYIMSQSLNVNNFAASDNHVEIGKIYYQAGIVALTASMGLPPGRSGPTNTAASATWTFSDKPNEDTTITLVDSAGTSVVFVIDDDANSGVSGTKVTQIAENGGGAAGTAIALDALINASALDMTSVRDGNKLTLTQDTAGIGGNRAITLSNASNWNSVCSVNVPAAFTNGTALEFHGGDFPAGTINSALTGATIKQVSDGIRNKINKISFNNTTELNSTIYFCRIHHNEFNYSSNPTYLTASKLRVKTVASDPPVSYITSVGLYGADNELLAVAKLSEPLKKDPTNELTLRVRLDY